MGSGDSMAMAESESGMATRAGSMTAPAPAAETAPMAGEEFEGAMGGASETGRMSTGAMRAFAKSDSIEHDWRMANGRRMSVSFRLSFSGVENDMQFASDSVRDNWASAIEYACKVCEATDLTDEKCRATFDGLMCRQLTQILFPQQAGQGQVERVVWDRLYWQ
ncbi:MAG: hypothetical protein NXI31_21975 [bacterium]|nr:hypothetical protein [bacterium]